MAQQSLDALRKMRGSFTGPVDPEQSLSVLSGGPRRVSDVGSLDEYGFGGDTPSRGELESPFEMEQAKRAARADVRDRAAFERVQDVNADVQEYNRPDVMEMRGHQQEDALKKLLGPIHLKGRYDVEAAKQRAEGQADRDAALIAGRADVARNTQAAITGRANTGIDTRAILQRLQALQTGKAHAAAPSGISGWVPGAQGRADQEEIANLMAQLSAFTGGETPAGDMTGGAPPAAAPGRVRRFNPATGRVE